MVGCEIKSKKLIFKIEILMYQSKVNLDVKFRLVMSFHKSGKCR